MNIEYAQTIPLRVILDKAGLLCIGENTKGMYLYASPFEEASSLQVDEDSNTWHHSDGQIGGGAYAFVQALLQQRGEPCAPAHVLHWLRFTIGYPPLIRFVDLPAEPEDLYQRVSKGKLREVGLIRYAQSKGIAFAAAGELFKQIHVRSKATGNEFVALGFKNEDGGFMLYNAHVAACLSPAAITFIRGQVSKPDTVHIFKDVFAYQAAIRARSGKPFKGDCIILNTWGRLDNAAAYIRGYGYQVLRTWFDNSSTGQQATAAFRWLCSTEESLHFQSVKQPSATS